MQNPPILTVTQLTFAIKAKLETAFPLIQVRGELSNLKRQSSGHLYFSLKDTGAQISGVMFRGSTTSLERMPREGDQVVAVGELNVYPPRGNYQIVVKRLQYVGMGELLLQLEALKKKLKELGWFDPAHKKPLPTFPKVIGVVTSPTGAVIQDILHILNRRQGGYHLILNPVKVQGAGAAEEIARAIADFNRYRLADVLIVGRGGGSIEDLWAFNEEKVVAAIFESQIPVISAVGHETDYCLSDFVADVRAPTPSAAAEIVMAEKLGLLQKLEHIRHDALKTLLHLRESYRHRLTQLGRHPLFTSSTYLLAPAIQRLDDLRAQSIRAIRQRLDKERQKLRYLSRHLGSIKPAEQIKRFKERLRYLSQALDDAIISKTLKHKRHGLSTLVVRFQSFDPKLLLNKGYTILFSEKKSLAITSCRQVVPGEEIAAYLVDGTLKLTVTEVEPK